MGTQTDMNRLCKACRHAIDISSGLGCLKRRSPVDGRPMLAGFERSGTTGCGISGAWWEPRPDLDPSVSSVLADPAASYWLKAAIASGVNRDPVDALADAESLVNIFKRQCDSMLDGQM